LANKSLSLGWCKTEKENCEIGMDRSLRSGANVVSKYFSKAVNCCENVAVSKSKGD